MIVLPMPVVKEGMVTPASGNTESQGLVVSAVQTGRLGSEIN